MNSEVITLEKYGISVGDVVTWRAASSPGHKVQGQVVSIDPSRKDPYEIAFYSESSNHFGDDYAFRDRSKPFTVFFCKNELKREEIWDLDVLLKRHRLHRAYFLHKPMDVLKPGVSICCHKNCTEPAREQSLCNVLGTVYVLYTCPPHHQEINGRWIEELPSDYPD
jgi:hypothetical protein